jgi:hypothetical protein
LREGKLADQKFRTHDSVSAVQVSQLVETVIVLQRLYRRKKAAQKAAFKVL